MNKSGLAKLHKLADEEKFEAMEALARKFIKADKKDGKAWKALGMALECQKKDSLPTMKQAIKLLPSDPQAYFNMGNALKWHNQKEQAVVYYKRALQLKPDYAEAWCNLGNSLQQTGEPYEALKAYWQGIKLAPQLVNIQLNMGNCYLAIGQHARAIRMYTMSLEIEPTFIEAQNAIIFARDLLDGQTLATALKDRTDWAVKFADPLLDKTPHLNDPDPERRIRVGYVSADFREHSAARSCGALFKYRDRERFELFAYTTTWRDPDHYTEMFRNAVDHWTRVTELTEDEFAEVVRRDQIDILVDLSGHSGGNRLLTFARKPAPIQCTGWGYATGTGMQAMDVLFADEICLPKHEQKFYVEKIAYLPCIDVPYWVETWPEVGPLPAAKDGILTFGSLNRMAKVTTATLDLWAKVLLAVPKSGFLMKAGEFGEESARERMKKEFVSRGVDADRLMLVGPSSWLDHMSAYQQIDICLDTLPQGGGVTTLEGVMMGVPVVTLRWPTLSGRVSASILTNLGMAGWIADTPEQYVEIAVREASDFERLAELRAVMRQEFQRTIGDGPAAARGVEAHYRRLWREWCEKQAAEPVFDKSEKEAHVAAH